MNPQINTIALNALAIADQRGLGYLALGDAFKDAIKEAAISTAQRELTEAEIDRAFLAAKIIRNPHEVRFIEREISTLLTKAGWTTKFCGLAACDYYFASYACAEGRFIGLWKKGAGEPAIANFDPTLGVEEIAKQIQAGVAERRSSPAPTEREYGFDVMLKASLRIKATSPEHAQELLQEMFDAANCNGGSWPDGNPVLFEASLAENSKPVLFSIDDEVQTDEGILAIDADTCMAVHVMIQDIVGDDYEDPAEVPECRWIANQASYSHAEVWEHILNMACEFESIPAKLAPVLEEAKSKGIAYVIFHQGT